VYSVIPGGHTAFKTVKVGDKCQMSSHPDASFPTSSDLANGSLKDFFHREPRLGFL
jgi:hypothetical protein